jgi:hypothetical protein
LAALKVVALNSFAERLDERPMRVAIISSHPRPQWFIRRSSWPSYYDTANVDKDNGGENDQVDCCCWFCFRCRDIGASNDTRADSSAGQHDHPSRLGLRAWQDNGPRSLRVQSLDPPEPQVFAMDGTHLRSVGLAVKMPPNWRLIDHKSVMLHY